MKKLLPLILGVGLLAFYFMSKRKPSRLPATATTGTADRPSTSYWDELLSRGTVSLGQRANRAVYGSSGGGGGGTDLSPLIKAGAVTLTDAAKKLFNRIWGSRENNNNTSPGTTINYGSYSTWDDYQRAVASQPENSEGGGYVFPDWESSNNYDNLWQSAPDVPKRWDNENDLPVDDSLDNYEYDL